MFPHISVAPMMDYTDRHARYFLRLISPHVLLYTEMITTKALLHGRTQYLLEFDPKEKYLALQLGGSDPKELAQCAKMGENTGYDEINLNVGCPSSRVSAGRFGACLMLEPKLVAECIATMQAQVKIPVTVKCRIGVDNRSAYEDLQSFVETVASAGCRLFIIHARKALLAGLNPKQNRTIPPLQYDVVRQIKLDFPKLTIILNGGITTVTDVTNHLPHVDGVMVGRAAYANPYLLAEIEAFYGQSVLTRHDIIQAFTPYVRSQLRNGVKLSSITRHILGLFQGERGAAIWRRHLSQYASQRDADINTIVQALSLVTEKFTA